MAIVFAFFVMILTVIQTIATRDILLFLVTAENTNLFDITIKKACYWAAVRKRRRPTFVGLLLMSVMTIRKTV